MNGDQQENKNPENPGNDNAIDSEELESIAREGEEAIEGEALPPEAEIPTAAILEPAIKVGFDVFAPNWKVKPSEVKMLAQVYGDLLDKYFPDGLNIGIEIQAIVITGMVIAPRISTPRTDEPKPEKSEGVPSGGGQATDIVPDLAAGL